MKTSKKWFLYAVIILLHFSFISSGCQKKEDTKKSSDESKSESPPPVLDELQNLSEELVQVVSKKDWATAVDKIKSMHTKWNTFYAFGQKSGLSQDQSTSFSNDLNNLTKLIISKAMEESKSKADTDIKKAQLELEQQMESNSQQEGAQKSSNQQQGNQQQGGQQQKSDSKSQQLTLPEEVAPDNYPDMVASPAELQVSNAAVQLTKHIPNFLSLYKDDMSPTVLKIKYLVRDIKIESKQNNWNQVTDDLKKVKENWTMIQPKILKEKEELGIQFNQSISELEQVASSKDGTLTTIKSDISLENIKKMIELFE